MNNLSSRSFRNNEWCELTWLGFPILFLCCTLLHPYSAGSGKITWWCLCSQLETDIVLREGSDDLQELLAHVGLNVSGERRVEVGHTEGPRPPRLPGRASTQVCEFPLVIVNNLLQCLIWQGRAFKHLPAGGKSVEPIIDTPRDILQDRRRVVGLSIDAHWSTVGFCERLIGTVSYVQSNIREIHDIFVNLNNIHNLDILWTTTNSSLLFLWDEHWRQDPDDR